MNVKGKGQRLIPEKLLKYLEKQNKKYPDPESLGTEVIANVEPVGGESNLTSIKIGNTIYLIPSGGTPLLEDIEDSAGNKRFIEGDGTPATITGITSSYCKWSLSGTHLMLVYAGTMTGDISAQKLVSFSIPEWCYDKIFPIGLNGKIEKRTMNIFSTSIDSGTSLDIAMYKNTNDKTIDINLESVFNRSQVYGFRYQFDLLIDADYSE